MVVKPHDERVTATKTKTATIDFFMLELLLIVEQR